MSRTFAEIYFPAIAESSQLVELFGLMCRFKTVAPVRYDDVEPIRKPFDITRARDIACGLMLNEHFLWIGSDRIASGSIELASGKGKQTGSLTVWTDIENFEDTSDLPELLKSIAGRFTSTYGYIHHVSDPAIEKAKESLPPGTKLPNSPMMGVSRWQLVLGLPGIYWANIFGPEYVALFGGRERVLSTPVPVIEEVAPKTFYLQLSDNMLDFATRFEEMAALQRRVKEHLGADCFVDHKARYTRTYRVPELGWNESRTPPLSTLSGPEIIERIRSGNIAARSKTPSGSDGGMTPNK